MFVSVVPEVSAGSVATGTVTVFVAPAAMLVIVQVIVVCPAPGTGDDRGLGEAAGRRELAAPGV